MYTILVWIVNYTPLIGVWWKWTNSDKSHQIGGLFAILRKFPLFKRNESISILFNDLKINNIKNNQNVKNGSNINGIIDLSKHLLLNTDR